MADNEIKLYEKTPITIRQCGFVDTEDTAHNKSRSDSIRTWWRRCGYGSSWVVALLSSGDDKEGLLGFCCAFILDGVSGFVCSWRISSPIILNSMDGWMDGCIQWTTSDLELKYQAHVIRMQGKAWLYYYKMVWNVLVDYGPKRSLNSSIFFLTQFVISIFLS